MSVPKWGDADTYRVASVCRRWGWTATLWWTHEEKFRVQGRSWTKRGAMASATKCIGSAHR